MWVSIENTSDLNNFGDWFYNISDTADPSTYRLRQDNNLECVPQAFMNDGRGCSNIWHGETVYAYSWTMKRCCIIFPNLAPTTPLWIVNSNATFVGYERMEIGAMNLGGVNVSKWIFGADQDQIYYARSDNGLPFALDINPGSLRLVWFNISLDEGSWVESVFDIPNIDQCVKEKLGICRYD